MLTKIKFLEEMNLKKAIILSLFATLLLYVSAQVSIHLPFTPVPISMQTFAIFVIALTLGWKISILSITQYIALGVMGLPVFTDGRNAAMLITGPTAGYILGFLIAAYLIGKTIEATKKDFKSGLIAGSFGILAIYICGAAWLTAYMNISTHTFSLAGYFYGALPFIGFDFAKLIVASIAVFGLKKIKD